MKHEREMPSGLEILSHLSFSHEIQKSEIDQWLPTPFPSQGANPDLGFLVMVLHNTLCEHTNCFFFFFSFLVNRGFVGGIELI